MKLSYTDGIQAMRCVTHQKGCWRWQDAYQTSWYGIRLRLKCRPGQSTFVWACTGSTGKYAITKARPNDLEFCSLHNHPVTPEQLMALALAEEITGVQIRMVAN